MTTSYDRRIRELLIHGEVSVTDEGRQVVSYPTQTALAKRFGVSRAHVNRIAQKYRTEAERVRARDDVRRMARERAAEMRAETGLSREDVTRVIDMWLAGFARALDAGQVPFGSVPDYHVLTQLRESLGSGQKARAGGVAGLTLAALGSQYALFKAK